MPQPLFMPRFTATKPPSTSSLVLARVLGVGTASLGFPVIARVGCPTCGNAMFGDTGSMVRCGECHGVFQRQTPATAARASASAMSTRDSEYPTPQPPAYAQLAPAYAQSTHLAMRKWPAKSFQALISLVWGSLVGLIVAGHGFVACTLRRLLTRIFRRPRSACTVDRNCA